MKFYKIIFYFKLVNIVNEKFIIRMNKFIEILNCYILKKELNLV